MAHAWLGGFAASILTPIFLAWAGSRTRAKVAEKGGWRTLRPGPLITVALAGGSAFSFVCFYIYFFVGSDRSDADQQMFYCLVIAFAFLALTLIMLWLTIRRSIQWRADGIREHFLLRKPRFHAFRDLDDVRYSAFMVEFLLSFRGGATVRISPYFHGAQQLLTSLDRTTVGMGNL